MDLRTPMQLFRNQELVGLITAYFYETPWATGTLQDSDPARGARSDRAASYLQWLNETENLPEDADSYDRLCTQELARRDVTQADVDWCEYGTWTIKTQDGLDHKTYSLEFLGDGHLQWRW